jgi:hypothetical protein
MAQMELRKYGESAVIDFELYDITGVDLKIDAVHASGDTKIMKNEAAEANTTNGFVDEGQGYSITLTATEMQAARIVLYIVDAATKVWLDKVIIIETFGNASAQYPDNYPSIASAVFEEALSGHVTSGSFGAWLNDPTKVGLARRGVLDTTPVDFTQITLDAAASPGTNRYVDSWLTILSSSGTTFRGTRRITAYNGTTKVATVVPTFLTDVASGDNFFITPFNPTNTGFWRGTEPNALVSGRIDASIGAIVDGVITATKFAAAAFADVWASYTRRLSDGTNISLAKGSGVTGFNDLSGADVRGAVGLTSANLDTQLATLLGKLSILGGTAQGAGAGANTLVLAAGSILAQGEAFFVGSVISILDGSGKGSNRIIATADDTTDVVTVTGDWDIPVDNTSVYAVFRN